MARNFPNLMKDINLHVQEAQQLKLKKNEENYMQEHHNQTSKPSDVAIKATRHF